LQAHESKGVVGIGLCIFLKTNGLLALGLLFFCSVREQRSVGKKLGKQESREYERQGKRLGRAMPA
jgi:hypothetical protein